MSFQERGFEEELENILKVGSCSKGGLLDFNPQNPSYRAGCHGKDLARGGGKR